MGITESRLLCSCVRKHCPFICLPLQLDVESGLMSSSLVVPENDEAKVHKTLYFLPFT